MNYLRMLWMQYYIMPRIRKIDAKLESARKIMKCNSNEELLARLNKQAKSLDAVRDVLK